MNVYIVSTGTSDEEGSTPFAAFGTLQEARKFCAQTFTAWPSYRYTPSSWVDHINAHASVWIHRLAVRP